MRQLRTQPLGTHPRTTAVLVLTVLLLAACGDTAPASTAASRPATGQELYQRHGCPLCHGPEGRGDGPVAPTLSPPPRDLRDPSAYRIGPSEEEIASTIETGILVFGGSGMASYGHIPAEERRELARFIVGLQVSPPPVADGEPETSP